MSIVIRSEQNYRTEMLIRNHTLIADEPLQDGGADEGPTPMEILVGTIGACVAVTTRAYAQRKNWPLESISVEVEMERFKRDEYPDYTGDAPYVHEVRERISFGGPLSDEQKARLMNVAAKCPVHLTLENPVIFIEKLVESEIPPRTIDRATDTCEA
jgi:putative redox protein